MKMPNTALIDGSKNPHQLYTTLYNYYCVTLPHVYETLIQSCIYDLFMLRSVKLGNIGNSEGDYASFWWCRISPAHLIGFQGSILFLIPQRQFLAGLWKPPVSLEKCESERSKLIKYPLVMSK